MPKYTIENLIEMSPDNFYKKIASLKYSEATEMLTLLNNSRQSIKSEHESNYKELHSIITSFIQQKDREHRLKYGKDLPPILIDYFEEYFPTIKDNIHKQMRIPKCPHIFGATPLELALLLNNKTVLNELFSVYTIEKFCDIEPKSFTHISEVDDEIFKMIINKFSEVTWDQQNKFMVLFLQNSNENRRKYIFEKFKNINLFAAEPIIYLPEFCDYLMGNSFETLSYLIKRSNFEQLNENNLHSLKKLISGLLNRYAENAINIWRGAKYKDLYEEAVKSNKNIKKLINLISAVMPGDLKKIISESFKERSIFGKVAKVRDDEMIRFLMDYNKEIPAAGIRDILSNKNSDDIRYLSILKDYFEDERIINELLIHLQSDLFQYNLDDIIQLPKLPFKWTKDQKKKLYQILSPHYDYMGFETTEKMSLWIKDFEKENAIFEKLFNTVTNPNVSTPIQIDDALFGHVNNDHILKGTKLEGMVLEKSLRYFNKFVNDLKKGDWIISGLTESEKKNILSSMEAIRLQFLNCQKMTEVIAHATSHDILGENFDRNEIIDNVSNFILKNIIENDGGIIPGGWIGLNNTGGHAMLYEFIKTENGFRLIIHNSGAGLKYHETLEKPSGTFYATSKIYEIPTHSLEDFKDNLKSIITCLVKPKILPAFNDPLDAYNEDRLYKEITETISRVGLREVTATVHNAEWTKGQSSGTCSWWALRSYLKFHLEKNGIKYDDINYEMRRYSIAEYYQNHLESNTLHDPIYQNQINFAAQNLARDIRRMASKHKSMTLDRQKEGLALLKKVTTFESPKESLETKTLHEKLINPSYEMHFKLNKLVTSLPNLSSNVNITIKPPNTKKIVFDPKDPLKSFSNLWNICNENLTHRHFSVVSKTIEDFYFSLPKDCSLKGWVGKKELSESLFALMELVQKINSIYTMSLAKQSIIPFAEQYMIHHTNLLLAHSMANKYFKDQKLQEILGQRLNASERDITHSPYFTNPDPLNNDKVAISERTGSNDLAIAKRDISSGDPFSLLVPAELTPSLTLNLVPAKREITTHIVKYEQAEAVHLIITQDPTIQQELLKLLENDTDYIQSNNPSNIMDTLTETSDENIVQGIGGVLPAVEANEGVLPDLDGLQPPSLSSVNMGLTGLDDLTPAKIEQSSPDADNKNQSEIINLEGTLAPSDSLSTSPINKPKLGLEFQSFYQDKIPDSLKATQYYLKTRHKLKNNKKFKKIEENIRFMLNAEKIRSNYHLFCAGGLDDLQDKNLSYLDEFYQESYKDLEHFDLDKDRSGKYYMVGSLGYLKAHERGSYYYGLDASQPSISSNMMKDFLNPPFPINSNQIQTRIGAGPLTEAFSFERSVGNTKLDKRTQVSATIDLIKKEFLRLHDPNFQNFIFLNLFQGNLLQTQLKDSPSTAKDLINLIKRGLDTFSESGHLKQPAVFMLKLSLCLEIHLSRLSDDYGKYGKELRELLEIHKEIAKKIIFYEKLAKKTTSPLHFSVLRQLHGYNIIHLRNQIRQQPKIEPSVLDSILDSWLKFKNLSSTTEFDPFYEYQVNKAFSDAMPFLKNYCDNLKKQNKEKFKNMLNSLISKNGIPIPSGKFIWEGEFPSFKLTSKRNILLSINILTGDIFQNSIQKKQLPAWIFNDPLYISVIRYFPSEPVSVSPDKRVYEFQVKGIMYRFSISPEGQSKIHKLMEIDGKNEWYEYQTKTLSDLPRTLNEKQHSIWISTSANMPQQRVIVNNITNETLALTNENGQIAELGRQDGRKTGYYMINAAASKQLLKHYPFLINIEDPNLIQFWKSDINPPPKGEIEIRLIRYGLSFKQKINADDSLGDIIWIQDPRYKIKNPADKIIPNFKNMIQLQSLEDKNLHDIAIIPKRQFVTTEDNDNEFYNIELDVRMTKTQRRRGKIDFIDMQDSVYSTKKNFTNQEKYVTYKIQQGLDLKPESSDDRIFLTYLLLGKRQALPAYECLNQVSPPITKEQEEWLKNIIFNLPLDKGENIAAETAVIESPEFMAVRALAASILAEHKLIENDRKKQEVASGITKQTLQSNTRMTGDKKLNQDDKLLEVYTNYIKKLKKVPDGMQLSRVKERHLLRYLMNKIPNVPSHVHFRRQKFAIESALLEERRLEKTLKNYKPESKEYNRIVYRLNKLKSRVKRLATVSETHAAIENIQVSIYPDTDIIYPYPSVKELLLGQSPFLNINFVPVHKLNLYTKNDNFYFSFLSYVKLALETNDATGQREALNKVIQDLLLDIVKKIHNKHLLSFRENLTVLLAYVIKYPHSFRKPLTNEAIEEYLSSLLEVVTKLKTEEKDLKLSLQVPTLEIGKLTIPEKPFLEEEAQLNLGSQPITLISEKETIFNTFKARFGERSKNEFKLFLDSQVYHRALEQQKELKDKIEQIESQLNYAKTHREDIQFQKEFDAVKAILMLEKLKDDFEGIDQNLKLQYKNKISQEICEVILRDKDAKLVNELERANLQRTEFINNLKQEILKLANQGPSDPTSRLTWELQLLGNERSQLSFEKVLRIFLTQDRNFYKQNTELDNDNINKLNNLIFQFLNESTKCQQEIRFATALRNLLDPGLTEDNRSALMNSIGTILEVERCYDPRLEPEILMFEYLEDKLLYKKQYEYLKGFLAQNEQAGFDSQAVQLIMGGGKSKVLLPLLALKKATGSNLSILEVPDALFQVNRGDLSGITRDKFGQDIKSFYFNDTIHCDSAYLKNLRNNIREAMEERQSLITTKESMQSFELSFLRFLRFMDPSNPEDVKKAKLFTEILNIFKYQSDVIIDEIDSTLDVRKQLIYTVGAGEAIPKEDLKSVLDLFLFLENLTVIIDHKPQKFIQLKKLIQGTQTCSESDWKTIFEFISYQLVNNVSIVPPTNPLKPIIDKLLSGKNELEQKTLKVNIIQYLLGKQKEPDFFSSNILTSVEKDQLAIYKEQITTILPLTLKKNLEEHFGLPIDPSKNDEEREIAIPYLASNTPSEHSKFGNNLETINYTLRIQLNKPLSLNTVKAMIHAFKAKADEERRYYTHFPKPEHYKSPEDEFYELTHYKLEDIDFEDTKGLYAFYEVVKTDKKVKEYCLLNHILNHIQSHNCILTSDAQNHGSQFRSVQGMTGTDWNYRCYPREPNVKINKTLSIGSDGQTRNHLQRDPQDTHLLTEVGVNNESKIKLALDLFNNSSNKDKLHSWIDIGAYFKGIGNTEVARQFSKYFSRNKDFSHLKYVLYFGEDNKLYAIPTSGVEPSIKPILLERTDPSYILEKLNSRQSGGEPITLKNIFTYYDQRRTTGTDIAQDPNAHAFASIGLKTIDRDLLQGVMRMRELRSNQRVEFVIPKEIQDANPSIKKWNVDSIMQFCFNNQMERLADDHYRSALQKIQNVTRNDLFSRLISSYNPREQREWMEHFDKVFFKIDNRSAFERYGVAATKVLTQEKFEEYGKIILEQWSSIIQNAKISDISKQEIEIIRKEILDIIYSSIDICNKEVEHLKSANALYDSQVEICKEEEIEKEEELEIQLLAQGDVFPSGIEKLTAMDFSIFDLTQDRVVGGGGLFCMPLESMVQKNARATLDRKEALEAQEVSEPTWKFSNNLFASRNFYQTYQQQNKFIDAYSKDSIFFLTEQDNTPPGSIKFLLITPEEAGHIRDELRSVNQTGNKRFWVETAHNTVHSGVKPEKLHPDYDKGIEQIAFFGADTDLLYYHLNDKSWITENPAEKLQYLEQVLYPIHKDKVNMIDSLKEKLLPKDVPSKEQFFSKAGKGSKNITSIASRTAKKKPKLN